MGEEGTKKTMDSARNGSPQEFIDFHLKMRDGVNLAVDICRPDTPGKFPVLLAISTYGKDLMGTESYIGGNYLPVGRTVAHTMYHDKSRSSYLFLPVILAIRS